MLSEQEKAKLEEIKAKYQKTIAEQTALLKQIQNARFSLEREIGYLTEAKNAAQDHAKLVIEQKDKEIAHRKEQIAKLPVRKATAEKHLAEAETTIAQTLKVLMADKFLTVLVNERKMLEADALLYVEKVQKWQSAMKFEGNLLQAEAQMKLDEENAAKKKKGGK